jgi:hypothetical protein
MVPVKTKNLFVNNNIKIRSGSYNCCTFYYDDKIYNINRINLIVKSQDKEQSKIKIKICSELSKDLIYESEKVVNSEPTLIIIEDFVKLSSGIIKITIDSLGDMVFLESTEINM